MWSRRLGRPSAGNGPGVLEYQRHRAHGSWVMTGDEQLTWTSEAQVRLARVPAGAMRDMTRKRVDRLAREMGRSEVTVDLMDAKYRQWAEGSEQAASQMVWTDEALVRVERIPDFVRGMVVQAIESSAEEQGLDQITAATLDAAMKVWHGSGRFHRP